MKVTKELREQFIHAKMQEHWDYLMSTDYEVVAIFLQGSQNYGTDLYTAEYCSDVDTKAIILPKLDDIVNGSAPTSYTHIMPDNSHIDIKDIRAMIDMWEKLNISYLELLYTDYYIINLRYRGFIEQLWEIRDDIANMHVNQVLRCIKGMSGNKIKALEHPYPTIADKIEKYGYDSKQLLHIVRITDFTKQYLSGVPVKQCYSPKKGTLKFISKIRKYDYSLEEARRIAKKYDAATVKMVDDYVHSHLPDDVDEDTIKQLHKIKAAMIKYALQNELSIGTPLAPNKYLRELGIDENTWPFDEIRQNIHNKEVGKRYDARYIPTDGFIDAEAFNLDSTLAMIIYSYLCYFRDTGATFGHPASMEHSEWQRTLDCMITSFRMYIEIDDKAPNICEYHGDIERWKRDMKRYWRKINYGMRLFVKHFSGLWW